jgi:hypothetical protein
MDFNECSTTFGTIHVASKYSSCRTTGPVLGFKAKLITSRLMVLVQKAHTYTSFLFCKKRHWLRMEFTKGQTVQQLWCGIHKKTNETRTFGGRGMGEGKYVLKANKILVFEIALPTNGWILKSWRTLKIPHHMWNRISRKKKPEFPRQILISFQHQISRKPSRPVDPYGRAGAFLRLCERA